MTHNGNVENNKKEDDVDKENNLKKYLENICGIMLNKNASQVAYLVLDSGSILRMNRKSFAIPLTAIQFDSNKECFILTIDKEKLKNTAELYRDYWPDTADWNWCDYISGNYGTKSIWE